MINTDKMKILGIETSCDETAAAVFDSKKGLLSSVVASQIDIHKKTGGVVPEVASRAHVGQIIPVIDEALVEAKTKPKDIDLIAVTHAPGLIGSLLVGVNTAKTLSFSWDKPLMPINHIEAHIYANFVGIADSRRLNADSRGKNFRFPAVVLIVSGGHTSLVLMKDHGKYQTLGETLDDAAGEAFDKVAKVLGLEYPGGPNISKAAEEYRKKFSISPSTPSSGPRGNFQFPNKSQIQNSKKDHFFPRPMIDSGDFNFSFSGLKTSVLYAWQSESGGRSSGSEADRGATSAEARKQLFAYEFEEAVVDILSTKTIEAAKKYKAKTVSICGGVSANKRLREELGNRIKKELPNTKYLIPNTKYSGDNAAMVAVCAAYKVNKKSLSKYRDLDFEVESSKQI